jgi:hypothetical protein
MVNDEIGAYSSPSNLAKTFFDLNLDPYFRSSITEARLYMALYKNFSTEIDDDYLKYAVCSDSPIKAELNALVSINSEQ